MVNQIVVDIHVICTGGIDIQPGHLRPVGNDIAMNFIYVADPPLDINSGFEVIYGIVYNSVCPGSRSISNTGTVLNGTTTMNSSGDWDTD